MKIKRFFYSIVPALLAIVSLVIAAGAGNDAG
jgi:hypothetical protein